MPSRINTSSERLFEIKAGFIHSLVLKLLSDDVSAISLSLKDKLTQAPDFFHKATLVIDLNEIPESEVDLLSLTSMMREQGLMPVGIKGGSKTQQQAAEAAGIAVFSDAKHEPASQPAAAIKEPTFAKLIEHPVRSGQRIYAQDCDLIVMAQVSAGAEIIADGNIHVYGSLRGRALAGVKGKLEARIFCTDLQAELISIAGNYKTSELLGENVSGKPVQVFLREQALIIEAL